MTPLLTRILSNVCFVAGFVSIGASILFWMQNSGQEYQVAAHAERFAIFVGLWAPTFFILSDRIGRDTAPTTRVI